MSLELSENECEKVVRKATENENLKVVKFHIESFGSYLGFLGEYFRLKIEADVEGNIREFEFFMKTLPIKDRKQRNMLVETGIFRKEVELYKNLLPVMSQLTKKASDCDTSWCPKVYLQRDDLLVLENLSLKGYKILPVERDLDQLHVEVLLTSLARFHCSSIVYEQIHLKGIQSIGDIFENTLFETSVKDQSWFHAGLKVIFDIALEQTRFGKSHRELLESDFYDKTFQVIDIMESSPSGDLRVLSHRDIWKNNLMFKFDDKFGWEKPLHCVLVDFQTARYLSITIDVLMGVLCTTRRGPQDELYDYYLKFYYDELSKELKNFNIDLKDKITFDNFIHSCEYHKAFALVYHVIILMITQIPRENFINTNEDDFREFADGNRSPFILDYMSKNKIYKERLIEAVEAVIKFIYKLP